MTAGKVVLTIILLGIGIFLVINFIDSYDLYKDAQHDVEVAKARVDVEKATDNCLQTKNDYIAQYGALPEQYTHMCEGE